MAKLSAARALGALLLLSRLSIAQIAEFSVPEMIPGLNCIVGQGDFCRESPDGTIPFLMKMCSKGGLKQIDSRKVLKNIDPVGTKKDAYCDISTQKPVYPVCIFDGKEYDVNDKGEVKFKASGTRTADAASSTTSLSVSASVSASATSTFSFATATNYASKATCTLEPTLSEGSSSSSDDDATRTTDASTATTDPSSEEAILRTMVDVTITIPPPAASTTAANAPMSSASAAGGSLMADGVVGSLVVAFFVGIFILVLFGID